MAHFRSLTGNQSIDLLKKGWLGQVALSIGCETLWWLCKDLLGNTMHFSLSFYFFRHLNAIHLCILFLL